MAINFKKIWEGLTLVPKTSSTADSLGEIEVLDSDNKVRFHNGTSSSPVVTEAHSATLTNKGINADNNTISELEVDNLKAGVLNTDVAMTGASNTQLPSALAIKTYIDNVAAAQNEASEIAFTPAGTISATNVQAAAQELDGDIQAHLNDTIDAHDASAISITAIPTIAATEVQGALTELQSDISAVGSDLGAHIVDTVDAHDASAISVIPSGNLASTEVQAALVELQSDVDTRATSSALTTHTGATSGVHGVTGNVVGTTDTQTLTNKTITGASIQTPTRSDVKQDTRANLETYATTASNGQIVFATDEKQMFQVVDGQLVSIGGQAIVKPVAGETLALNDLVYISTGTGNDSGRTAGRVYKVDASNDDRVEVLGFVTKAGSAGATIEVQTAGIVKGLSGLTPGRVYYATTTPGTISTTPPSTINQWIVAIGLAVSATEIAVNPVASASAIFITDAEQSFTIANNQSAAANVTNLLFDGVSVRGFAIEYTIYRQTDTASSAVAQIGQLRGVYNTQSATWLMSDDYSGQNAGVTFSIQSTGQIRYTSSNIAGANYVGTLKYSIRKTFGV